MKKKRDQSGAASSGQQPGDYVVGQVSGSLFQKNSAASGSSLSALFSTTAPAAAVLFQPAPKPVKRSIEVKENQTQEDEGESSANKKSTKQLKKKSEAEQKLENRELSLQVADEDEGGQQKPSKKKKKKNESELAESGRVNEAEHWVMKRQKQRARKEEEAKKSKRTVFVGNLPISCTKKMLMTLFRDKGPIESIRFRSVVREDPSISRKVAVIQRKAHPKKQSMNAYVVFKDEEGVARALERNGAEIDNGFHIRVDRVASGSSHDHKRSVFVGNLSFEINELALRRHFEECGSVEAVRLVRDQNSGLGKGFGYVLFESADSVQLALKLDGTKLEGRSVRVKRSVKKEKQKTKPDSKMAAGRPGRSPSKGPPKGQTRGPAKGQARGPARGPAKGQARGPARGPAKGPARGPGRDRGGGREFKKFSGKQKMSTNSSGSFSGEKVDPNKKPKKKGLKKKAKPKKAVHI